MGEFGNLHLTVLLKLLVVIDDGLTQLEQVPQQILCAVKFDPKFTCAQVDAGRKIGHPVLGRLGRNQQPDISRRQ